MHEQLLLRTKSILIVVKMQLQSGQGVGARQNFLWRIMMGGQDNDGGPGVGGVGL